MLEGSPIEEVNEEFFQDFGWTLHIQWASSERVGVVKDVLHDIKINLNIYWVTFQRVEPTTLYTKNKAQTTKLGYLFLKLCFHRCTSAMSIFICMGAQMSMLAIMHHMECMCAKWRSCIAWMPCSHKLWYVWGKLYNPRERNSIREINQEKIKK